MTEVNDNGASRDQEEMQQTQDLRRPGELLRYQREVAGLSQTDVAEGLHLTVHYINALESDDYSKLPGLTFVKGYFRAYARYLQMDEEQVVECYERFLQVRQSDPEEEQTYRVRRRNDQAVLWAVAAAVILVVALACGWWFFGRQPAAEVSATGAAVPLETQEQQTDTAATPFSAADEAESPAGEVSYQLADMPSDVEADAVNAGEAGFVQAAGTDSTAAEGEMLATELQPEQGAEPLEVVTDEAVTETGQNEQQQSGTAAADAEPADAQVDTAVDTERDTESDTDDEAPTAAAAGTEQTEAAPTGDATADTNPFAPESGNGLISTAADGSRQVSLLGDGDDLLQISFSATSWVEVDDAGHQRLYNDLMQRGDELSIRSMAPFYVVLGDATNSEVQLNGELMNLQYRIRANKSARFEVSAEGVKRWVVE